MRLRVGLRNAARVAASMLELALAATAALALVVTSLAWVRPASALPLRTPGAWSSGGAAAAQAAAALASGELGQAVQPRLAGARHLSGHERRGYVAFTFDDGPHAGTTPRVLAALQAHEVPAAFFVCGYQIDGVSSTKRANARVLDDVIAAGFLVGNHTYHHTHLGSASLPFAWNALVRNERLIAPHLGRTTRVFRAPYGQLSRVAERLLGDLGYTIVRWSIDPGDYRSHSPAELRDRVLRDIIAAGGGVVLLHDTKPWTAKALPMILAGLERENCRRLARGVPPILPVSLDYFATDGSGAPLPVGPEVELQTERTRAALARRCVATRPD